VEKRLTLTLPLAMRLLALKMNLPRKNNVGSIQDEYPWYTALVTVGGLSKRGSSAHAIQIIRITASMNDISDIFVLFSLLIISKRPYD
jgi:hypothetical protein